jgi:SAM-dependent methyltransferase
MDDRNLDERALVETLDSFKPINRLISRTRHLLRRTVVRDMLQRKATAARLLDLGSGGCDEARWFVKECRKYGIEGTVVCLDADPRAVRYARHACRDESSIEIVEADALRLRELNLSVDYIFSNHFLHHLDSAVIPDMLRQIQSSAPRGFALQDLHRHPVWYFGFGLIGALAWRRGWTFADGLSSISRGFARTELVDLCRKAGVECRVMRSAPGHWCLTNIPA